MRDTLSEQSHGAGDFRSGGALWIAAPFALVVTFFLARILPIYFPPPPNPMGIVSWSTRNGYPPIQEIFWYGFSLAIATGVTWGLARLAGRFRSSQERQVALEALAASSLLSIVFLPASFAFALAGACAIAAGVLISARGEIAQERSPVAAHGPVGRSRLRGIAFAICAAALALLLSPSFWLRVVEVSRGTPDEAYANDGWVFQAEWGQFLAWADGLFHGQAPGRDFYMLYGPLYPMGVVAVWKVLGRSVAAWALYYAALNVLAVLAAIALAAQLIRRRLLCLALPLVFLPIAFEYGQGLELRYGLALAGLACLCRAFERESVVWIAAGGIVGGTGLLFSQEFGVAFLLTAAVALAVRGRLREVLSFGAGFVISATPCILWLACAGALAPTLHDLATYPALVMAGFGKLPFESAVRELPISLGSLHTEIAMKLRLGYTVPAICWAALLWAACIERLDPRRPLASLQRLRTTLVLEPQRFGIALLALFGLLAFRSALGRSSLLNTLRVCGAASILICVGLDRALDAVPRARLLAGWRLASLLGVALLGGMVGMAAPIAAQALRHTLTLRARMLGSSGSTEGSSASSEHPAVIDVIRWIGEHADPTDGILFLPNDAACYYLTDRRSPIRFVLGHQMVTNAHREEALTRLRAAPPRFVVFFTSATRLDGIPHEEFLGPAIQSWILEGYSPTAQLGSATILERRGADLGGRRDPAEPKPTLR